MKKRARLLLIVLGLLIALPCATWIYYRFQGPPREAFTPSIAAKARIEGLHWIPVTWTSDTLGDRTAMLLPVYVDTISKPFWMQFDLGTPITDFLDIRHFIPALEKHEVALDDAVQFQTEPFGYSGFDLRIGDDLVYNALGIRLYDEIPLDTLIERDSIYDTRIGSLGYDFIAGHILVIDFAHSRLAVTDSLPADFERRLTFVDGAEVDQFPIYLPITIDGREKLVEYDNGSSAFTLLLPPEQWGAWSRAGARIDTFPLTAWTDTAYARRTLPDVGIEVLGRDRSQQPIWTVSTFAPENGGALLAIKQFTDRVFGRTMRGTLGNEYYRNDVLVIDTRRNRFGYIAGGG